MKTTEKLDGLKQKITTTVQSAKELIDFIADLPEEEAKNILLCLQNKPAGH